MKKIIYLFAAAATLLAASCNKIETTEQEITPDAIQLNIKVANLTDTPDTKAAKTGWVSGDKINIWFDDWNNTKPVENHIPDMVITYDGSDLCFHAVSQAAFRAGYSGGAERVYDCLFTVL